MTQNLVWENVQQETDAQTINLNSGLWQGEIQYWIWGRGGHMPHSIGLFSKQLILRKHHIFQCTYICSTSYLRFTALVIRNFTKPMFYRCLLSLETNTAVSEHNNNTNKTIAQALTLLSPHNHYPSSTTPVTSKLLITLLMGSEFSSNTRVKV